MRKIIILIVSVAVIFFSFIGINIALENCDYSADGGLIKTLTDCIDESDTSTFGGVVPEGDLDLSDGDGFSILIAKWVKNMATILFIIAVGALIYASYLLVLSGGEEEKIKKAKDIIKWSLIGFIGLITAGLIVMLIVKMVYFVGT